MKTNKMVGKINRAGYIDIKFRGEIIKLLQRSEKFEEMWKELHNIYIVGINGLQRGMYEIRYNMEQIKQKHFPKGD